MDPPPAPSPTGRPAPPRWRRWKAVAVAAWKEAGDDNLGLIAAGVAFYAFLAFVPLLTAFVLSYGLVAEPASVVRHMQTLTGIMPHSAAEIIGGQLSDMVETRGATTGLALAVALGVALYGASRGAGSIILALNIVYRVGEARGFVGRTLVALTMTAGAVLALFLAILAISALNFLEELMPALGGVGRVLLQAAFFLLAGAAVALLLAVIYRYGPNRPDAEWRWITPGSALATIVWLAATWGFGAYVANFGNYNATYGSLGAVIVFLTWLYLTAYIVLLGAELNAVLERQAEPADAPSAAPAIPSRREAAEAPPSLTAVAARAGFFALLLRLLGRRRRDAEA